MEKTPLNFEASIKRLEEIVALLENPKTPLETSMTLFEEAVQLSKSCQTILSNVEQKVTVLMGDRAEKFDDIDI